jgi:hypothetical protein
VGLHALRATQNGMTLAAYAKQTGKDKNHEVETVLHLDARCCGSSHVRT